jgi:hypothetical protein
LFSGLFVNFSRSKRKQLQHNYKFFTLEKHNFITIV